MISAYVHSELGLQYYSAMETYRKQKQHEDDDDPVTSSSLLYVGDFSIEDINSAFELDWRQLNWSWLNISDSDFEYHDLKAILSNYYGLICRIFSHYCGLGKVGDTYGMNLMEFSHLVQTTGSVNWKTNAKKIEDIFFSVIEGSVSESESKSSASELISRCDFVYALVKIAQRHAKEQHESVIKAVKTFLAGPLSSAWEVSLSTYYSHRPDSLHQKTLTQYSANAKSLFRKFSITTRGCQVLNLAGFKNIFLAMAAIQPNDDKIISSAFVSAMPYGVEFEELVACEYLEAVCRLALQVVPDLSSSDKITDIQKIRMLFQSIADFEMNLGA